MKFVETSIKDLIVIEPKIWRDPRGYFYESFNKKDFEGAGIYADFVQDNQSLSQKGALRGLHAQSDPSKQGKLVRVIRGSVIDVAVDVRKDSSTFGSHLTFELTEENHRMLWVPPGFLHGFVTLADNTIFTYKVTALYDKEAETGVRWDDPDLAINWGIDAGEVLLSEKDLKLPLFRDFVSPF